MSELIAYASRTGTKRNLDALRRRQWRLLISASGVLRDEGFDEIAIDNGAWAAFLKGRPINLERLWECLRLFGKRANWTTLPDIVAGGLPYRLGTLPPDHKCHRLHGHTYRVVIALHGTFDQLDQHGMVVDYQQIADAWAPVHAMLDHQYLNDIPGLERPTTELLARWIICALYEKNPWLRPSRGRLASVRVYESASTYCEVSANEVHYVVT